MRRSVRDESPWVGDYRGQAEAYDLARPSYPEALIERLVTRVGVAAGDQVADVGAGTGIFTRRLAARDLSITGIEPDPAMRAQAPDLPGVTWRSGTFESLGLPDASQRWIVAAQSFQRADPRLAMPEIRRALAPGGCVSVVFYSPSHRANDVLEATATLLRRHVPEYHNPDRASAARRRASRLFSGLPCAAQRLARFSATALGRPDLAGAGGALVSTGDFARAAYDEAEHSARFDRDGYLALWESRSRLKALAGSRFQAFLTELGKHLSERDISAIEIPYVYGAWTARAASRPRRSTGG